MDGFLKHHLLLAHICQCCPCDMCPELLEDSNQPGLTRSFGPDVQIPRLAVALLI